MKHETPEQRLAATPDEDVAHLFHLAGQRLHEMKHPDAPVVVRTSTATADDSGNNIPTPPPH